VISSRRKSERHKAAEDRRAARYARRLNRRTLFVATLALLVATATLAVAFADYFDRRSAEEAARPSNPRDALTINHDDSPCFRSATADPLEPPTAAIVPLSPRDFSSQAPAPHSYCDYLNAVLSRGGWQTNNGPLAVLEGSSDAAVVIDGFTIHRVSVAPIPTVHTHVSVYSQGEAQPSPLYTVFATLHPDGPSDLTFASRDVSVFQDIVSQDGNRLGQNIISSFTFPLSRSEVLNLDFRVRAEGCVCSFTVDLHAHYLGKPVTYSLLAPGGGPFDVAGESKSDTTGGAVVVNYDKAYSVFSDPAAPGASGEIGG
jgi:hypothetical protein